MNQHTIGGIMSDLKMIPILATRLVKEKQGNGN